MLTGYQRRGNHVRSDLRLQIWRGTGREGVEDACAPGAGPCRRPGEAQVTLVYRICLCEFHEATHHLLLTRYGVLPRTTKFTTVQEAYFARTLRGGRRSRGCWTGRRPTSPDSDQNFAASDAADRPKFFSAAHDGPTAQLQPSFPGRVRARSALSVRSQWVRWVTRDRLASAPEDSEEKNSIH